MTAVHGVIGRVMTQMIYISIYKILFVGKFKNAIAIGCTQELTLTIEKFERVPMTRIVTGSENDTAIGLEPCYGKFGCRSGCQTYIGYIETHSQ